MNDVEKPESADPFESLQHAVDSVANRGEWTAEDRKTIEKVVGSLQTLLAARNTPVPTLKVLETPDITSKTVARLYALVGNILLRENVSLPLAIDIPEEYKAILDPEAREGLDNLTDGFEQGDPLFDSQGNIRSFNVSITQDALDALPDVVIQQSRGHLLATRTLEQIKR